MKERAGKKDWGKYKQKSINTMHANVASSHDEERGTGYMPQKFKVDQDSLLIGVDNLAYTLMINNIHHFIGTLITITIRVVKGYGGVIKVRGEGTVKW